MSIPTTDGQVNALLDIAEKDGADFLMDQFENMQKSQKKDKDYVPQKIAIHCMAGVGRTGTLMAIINSMIALKDQQRAGAKSPQLSVFSIVRRLREQRFDMCETKNQYKFIYEALQRWHVRAE